jgi:hypothetical protein
VLILSYRFSHKQKALKLIQWPLLLTNLKAGQHRYGDIQDQDLQLQEGGHRHGVIQMAENSTRDNTDRVEAHTASEAASVQTCHPRPLVWRTPMTIRSVAPTPTKQMKTVKVHFQHNMKQFSM